MPPSDQATESVTYDVVESHVALVRINRPDRRNAIDRSVGAGLSAAWERAESDPSVRAVVLSARGDRAFCAGYDLREREQGSAPTFDVYGPRVGTNCRLSKPLVGAITGPAIGAGFVLADACDLLVASSTAWFALPEASLGLPLDSLVYSLSSLPRRVLLEILVSGRRLDAQHAREVGFANVVCEPAEVEAGANEVARQIARNSPGIVRAAKRMVYESLERSAHVDLMEVSRAIFDPVRTVDLEEGFAARREQREPLWSTS